MNTSRIKGNLMLLTAAFIWGTAFVAQSKGMDFIGPFTFNTVRNYVAFIVLIPIIFLFKTINPSSENYGGTKELIKGGICCGAMLFMASSFQQIGIKYTTVGKAGFITTLYVLIIPLIGLFMGKRIKFKIWLSLAGAVLGFYLLCMSNGFENIAKGDFYVLLSAFFDSFYIITVGYFSPKADGVKMSCIQFLVCAIISTFAMFILEDPEYTAIIKGLGPILYTAVLSSGVAYTMQMLGQRNTEPVIASLIMSLESVFSAVAGWVVLGQIMSFKEILGCIIVFIAVTSAQIPEKEKSVAIKSRKIQKAD